jgi:hypothetical protein
MAGRFASISSASLWRLDRVFDQRQFGFLDLVGAQQVERAHQLATSDSQIGSHEPGRSSMPSQKPQHQASASIRVWPFVLVLAEQRLEFLRRDFEGDQHFVHEAHDQVDDAFFFLGVLPFRDGGSSSPQTCAAAIRPA